MSITAEIIHIIDGLSDHERERFLGLLRNAAGGERFWEGGVAAVYHEYVKTRSNNDLASASFDPGVADGVFAPIPVIKRYPSTCRIELPKSTLPRADLGGLLQSRRSRRETCSAQLSQGELAMLLRYAAGVTGTASGYGYQALPLRTFPTCGGLQSPEIYASVQNVPGIEPGIYHYEARQHTLALVRAGHQGQAISKVALDQPFIESAPLVLLMAGSFDRLRWKYGERAYRYMCADIGCLTQNLYLVGEALALSVCAIAGFIDDGIEGLIGLDGEGELALLLVTIGKPPGGAVDP